MQIDLKSVSLSLLQQQFDDGAVLVYRTLDPYHFEHNLVCRNLIYSECENKDQ
jgi:hypothetical protein